MRRLKNLNQEQLQLCEIHQSADTGIVTLMGGVFCKRNEQAISPYYTQTINKKTGEIKQSWFDGLITKKLKGIVHKGREIITRIHEWRLEHRFEKAERAFSL